MNRTKVSSAEIAYVDEGEGPAVLLLHGFPTSSFLWRREVPLLASRMRVIAPDLMGYGESDHPPDADLSMTAQARAVRELLGHLEIDECAVIGHDLGGVVAQLLALEGGVRTMVLIDSACFDAWPIEGIRMLQAAEAHQEKAEFVDSVVRLSIELGVSHRDRLDEPAVAAYARPWVEDPRAFFRAVRAIDGVGLAGREAELSALDIPALIIWGEDDPYLPAELAERLGEVLPGSTVALLPGCSHFVTEDAGPTVDQLLFEFLRLRFLQESHAHAHSQSGPVQVFLERPPSGFGLEDE
jgi:pimeloyl-ACP methyl ester carboxylesterase